MKSVILSILILCCLSCTSTKTATYTAEEVKTFSHIKNNGPFEMISDWAQPQVTNAFAQLGGTGLIPPGSNVGNISLIGNANYLRVTDSLISAYLPFYGERQFGGSIGSNQSGIEFEGVPKNLKTNMGKKNNYEIRFSINDKNSNSESYTVYVQVFPNLSSYIRINSSHRSSIQFNGKAKLIENEKK